MEGIRRRSIDVPMLSSAGHLLASQHYDNLLYVVVVVITHPSPIQAQLYLASEFFRDMCAFPVICSLGNSKSFLK